MAKRIFVDFSKARVSALRTLPTKVPQFHDRQLQPYRSINLYLRFNSKYWSKNSLTTNAQHFNEFLDWLENSRIDIEDLTARDLEHYADALCIYRSAKDHPLAWNTINSRVLAIHSYLKWAHDNKFAPNYLNSSYEYSRKRLSQKFKSLGHPAKQVLHPIAFLPLGDAVRFINSFQSLNLPSNRHLIVRNQLMASMMLEVGLRITEVVTFPFKDLPEINRRGIATPARVIGKGNKARMVLIPNRLLATLWEYADIYREKIVEKLSASEKVNSKTLFVSSTGAAISRNWIEKIFLMNSKNCQLKVHPHLLRHTFGTYHYLRNRDLLTLMKLMGHSSEETTREFYVHTASLVAQTENYRGLQDSLDNLLEISFE